MTATAFPITIVIDGSIMPPSPARLQRLATTAAEVGIELAAVHLADGARVTVARDPRFKKMYQVDRSGCVCSTYHHLDACVHHAAFLAAEGGIPAVEVAR